MEFYSSWIKLALHWVLGYFFSVNDEFCGGCGMLGLFTLLSLSLSLFLSLSFLRPRLLWNGHFFFLFWSIWPKCLWLDFGSWCKPPNPFALVRSPANHLPASVYMHMCTGELLNNSQWVQTVWVSCSRCSDGWYSLKFWLHNMSAHHNWWSFLSILMFIRENRKHIGLFWWYKFMLFFFSASTVCVSFRGYRNVLVYLRLVLAPNDLYLVFFPPIFFTIMFLSLYSIYPGCHGMHDIWKLLWSCATWQPVSLCISSPPYS